ncbi:MAG: hypothetical protein LBD11_03955 [Candidatus Peribacteria bacterium]|jgi:hypothetical protein|nr:hypothetical protein [Candidatus Peribacteria bacterium]
MIGGGYENEISSIFSTIGAGRRNKIAASHSIIPGGEQNIISANAEYSFAAGQMTNAEHPGSFLWSDYDNVRYE